MIPNYFEFYGLKPQFLLDESALKSAFMRKSRAFHPDFHTQATADEQAEVLKQSTYNTQAYETLKAFESRLRYILSLHGLLENPDAEKLDQDFLMQMMGLNEAVMELEFEFDKNIFENLCKNIEGQLAHLELTIKPLMLAYDQEDQHAGLAEIKYFYFKRKYLLRIQENLSKFAPH